MEHDTFPTNDLIQKYRNVFSHREAGDVLYHMLFEMGFFKQAASPEDTALRNYASRFLEILGGGEVQQISTTALIEQLKRQSMPKEE